MNRDFLPGREKPLTSNLDDFNEGWAAGWYGQPEEKGRGSTYKNAYNAASKASKLVTDDKRD